MKRMGALDASGLSNSKIIKPFSQQPQPQLRTTPESGFLPTLAAQMTCPTRLLGTALKSTPAESSFPRFGLGWRTWRTWRARREAGAKPLLVAFVRRFPKENTSPLSIWGSGGGLGFSKAKPIVFGPPFHLGDPKNWLGVEITGPPLAHET